MRHPDLRISSMVCASRLPFGIPNFNILVSWFAGILLLQIASICPCLRTFFNVLVCGRAVCSDKDRGPSAGGLRMMTVAGAILGGIDLARLDDLPSPVFEPAEKIADVSEMARCAV